MAAARAAACATEFGGSGGHQQRHSSSAPRRARRRRAGGDAERTAIHRAVLTVVIDAIHRADDSHGDLGELFREHERSYLDLIRELAGDRSVVRDLLELVIAEDYGLFLGIEGSRGVAGAPADVAVRVLAPIIAELRRERLTYPLGKALRLRRALLAAVTDVEGESTPPPDDSE
jgi:hypothetical protein